MANKIELRNGQNVVVERLPDTTVMPVGKTYIGEAGTPGVPVSNSDPMPVTGPLTQSQLAATPVSVTLPAIFPVSQAVPTTQFTVDPNRASTATRTTVAASLTSVTVVAANPVRRGLVFFNNSDASVFLGLGSTATTTADFTIEIPSHEGWTCPYNYDGPVQAVWLALTGALQVTELLA